MTQLHVLNMHTTSFHLKYMLHKHKIKVMFQLHPKPPLLSQGHVYWLFQQNGFLSRALQKWFQFFLINLAREPQFQDWGGGYPRDQQCGLFSVKSDYVVFYLMFTCHTASHRNRLASPPPSSACASSATDADPIPEALVWWASEGSCSHFCPPE